MIDAKPEIDKILKMIQEKTSLTIPSSMISVEETDLMKEERSIMGQYSYSKKHIFLNPKIFNICNDREYYREKSRCHLIKINGEYSLINTEEKLTMFMEQEIEREKLHRTYYVIAHECGHYVHDKYFGNIAQRIPIKKGYGYNGYNSRKNHRENFADGFAEYVLDLILMWNKNSKRQKKMQSLIEKIPRIQEELKEEKIG